MTAAPFDAAANILRGLAVQVNMEAAAKYAWIAAGGAAGAVSRWAAGAALAGAGAAHGFPLATLLVNLLGAYALGRLRGRWSSVRGKRAVFYQAVTGGFLGSFTTMSAFGLETWTLLADGRIAAGAFYALVSAAAGPLLARVGMRRGIPA